METKVKKILTTTANVLAIVIGVFVLLIAISAITSASEGYPRLFGHTVYAVETDSMEGDNEDSFNKNALIFVKLLSDEEKQNLEVGQVITFKQKRDVNGDGILDDTLNTHRIKSVTPGPDDAVVAYVTKGDKAPEDVTEHTDIENVVGVYSSKINGLGGVVLFVQSSTGFLVTVVIPSVLVVIYCAYLLIKNIIGYSKEKRKEDIDKIKSELKKEMENKQDN